jgi:hypothetical protein
MTYKINKNVKENNYNHIGPIILLGNFNLNNLV